MRGFTFIELIVATAILTSFLTLGIPKMHHLLERHHSQTAYNNLRRVLMQARQLAQDNLADVTACPMQNNLCQNNWDNPIHIFNDINRNNALDAGETLFFTTSIQTDQGHWQKSKDNQNFVRFNPLGHAFSSATTFLFCPYSNHLQLAKSIVISFQGRIRTEHYLNSRGVPYAKFRQLNCN